VLCNIYFEKKIEDRNISWYFVLKVARKLAMVEADLERAEERAETGES